MHGMLCVNDLDEETHFYRVQPKRIRTGPHQDVDRARSGSPDLLELSSISSLRYPEAEGRLSPLATILRARVPVSSD